MDADAQVITPSAELDLVSAPQLGAEVLDHLTRGELDLILDFAGVRMIDSVGIGVLLSIARRVQTAGGELVVANASERVRHVFELTGVARSLTLA